ncbi:MAG: PH domain-containing protein [Clostridia bacterium]|jgi:uncharacterized membrane protein YdbT with pleckstrin-like domain|nr:PH domain-containing protein [Clostridia bacterium]
MIHLKHPEEEVFILKPDERYKNIMFRYYFNIGFLLILLLMKHVATVKGYNWYDYHLLMGGMMILVVNFLISYAISGEYYANAKYKVTNKRVIIRSGFYLLRRNSINLNEIVDVDTVQTFYERNRHLGTIEIIAKGQTQKGKYKKYKLRSLSNFKEIEVTIRELIEDCKK